MYKYGRNSFYKLISFFLSFQRVRLQMIHRLLEKYPTEVLSTFSAHREAVEEEIGKEIDAGGEKAQAFEPIMEIFALIFRDRPVPDRYRDLICRATGAMLHYGQEAEDVALEQMELPEKGFFVDVGAHHPIRFSNTYALYRKGWRGINIDATPGSMNMFRKVRPDDTNIESAVSDGTSPRTFHLFEDAALNTFNEDLAVSYIAAGCLLKEKRDIPQRTLASILSEHMALATRIDLLSIDVEGSELAVLRSNDWSRYLPDIIVIEDLETSLYSIRESETVTYLSHYSYEPLSKISRSLILKRKI